MHTQSAHVPPQSQALGVKPMDAATFPVASSKADGSYYLVRENGPGSYTCTCGDYRHRKSVKGETCKHIEVIAPTRFRCPNCGEHASALKGAWCVPCDARLTAWSQYRPQHAPVTKAILPEEDIPVEQSDTYREAMIAVRAGDDGMSAAARNAKSVALHTFASGSQTLIAGSRPSPLESAGYR